jgi:acetolactate synthase-1/2/3 large subunit
VEFAEKYPDFTGGLKALYGIPGRRIAKRDEVDAAIAEMIASDGPYVLDVSIPKDEDVYPMIPGGATINDMILGEEQGHTPPI